MLTFTKKILGLALVAAASTIATTSQAQLLPDLIITEFDDNLVTLSGSDAVNWTLVNNGPDSWSATRSTPLTDAKNTGDFATWLEPEDDSKVNILNIYYTDNTPKMTLDFTSDAGFVDDLDPVADSTILTFHFAQADAPSMAYNVQVIDKGDTSRQVPDVFSTVAGMALGISPLLWLRHRRAKLATVRA